MTIVGVTPEPEVEPDREGVLGKRRRACGGPACPHEADRNGIVTPAMKAGTAGEKAARSAIEAMSTLNRAAAIGGFIVEPEGRIEVVV